MSMFKNLILAVTILFATSAVAAEMPIKSGEFADADFGHNGSGNVEIIKQDGKLMLKFDDFTVTPGPDLYVMFSDNPEPEVSQDILDGEFFELAKLSASRGAQSYAISDDVDIDAYNSVVIWCRKYSVLFAYAELK